MNKHHNSNEPKLECRLCSVLSWWATLVMAVLAMPIIGFVVASSVSKSSLGQMIVFVITCWACTWLGMKAMQRLDAKK